MPYVIKTQILMYAKLFSIYFNVQEFHIICFLKVMSVFLQYTGDYYKIDYLQYTGGCYKIAVFL